MLTFTMQALPRAINPEYYNKPWSLMTHSSPVSTVSHVNSMHFPPNYLSQLISWNQETIDLLTNSRLYSLTPFGNTAGTSFPIMVSVWCSTFSPPCLPYSPTPLRDQSMSSILFQEALRSVRYFTTLDPFSESGTVDLGVRWDLSKSTTQKQNVE